MLYSHEHQYILICRWIQNHNDDTIRRATQFFRKIYLSLYWMGCVWEGVGDRTELQHIDPHSYGHNSVSFPFSWAAQPGARGPSLSGTCCSFQHLLSNWSELQLLNRGSWGPRLLGAGFLYHILSPTDWTSCVPSYTSTFLWASTFFLWASQIALIQPVHGQGYILIFLDRMHLLFKEVHFLFWKPGRVGGQYTTTVLSFKLRAYAKLNYFK